MEDDIEAAAVTGHRYIERNPDAAVGYELLGRVGKHRQESGWQDLLKKAADRYAVEGRMQDLPSAANLYRLTGHGELAEEYWQQELDRDLEDFRYSKMSGDRAIAAAYFLNDQVQFEAVCEEVLVVDQGWWTSLPRLRNAQLAKDHDAIVAEMAKWQTFAATEPIASNGANPSAHDLVEHIQEILAGLAR